MINVNIFYYLSLYELYESHFPIPMFVIWIIPFAGVISVYLIDNNKLPITLTLRDVIKVCLRHRREFLFLNVSCVQQARCCKITFLSLCLNNFLMDCENIQSFNTSASSAIIMYWILTFYQNTKFFIGAVFLSDWNYFSYAQYQTRLVESQFQYLYWFSLEFKF